MAQKIMKYHFCLPGSEEKTNLCAGDVMICNTKVQTVQFRRKGKDLLFGHLFEDETPCSFDRPFIVSSPSSYYQIAMMISAISGLGFKILEDTGEHLMIEFVA